MPGRTAKETSSSALMPPKRRLTPSTRSSGTSTRCASSGAAAVVDPPRQPAADRVRLGGARLRGRLLLGLGVPAEVEALHLVALGQLVGGAGQRHPPDLERDGVLGDPQCHRRVLLDDDDRGPLLVDLFDDRPDAADHLRREAQRRLVEQQELRAGHQRPADREHLLLPAGEQPGACVARSASTGNSSGRARGPRSHPRVARQPAGPQVLLDGHPGEDLASLGNRDDAPAHHERRVEPVDALTLEGDLAGGDGAAVQLQRAGDRAQQRGLAGAVAAQHGEHGVVGHLDVDVLERSHRAAVPHRQTLDDQHSGPPSQRQDPESPRSPPRAPIVGAITPLRHPQVERDGRDR